MVGYIAQKHNDLGAIRWQLQLSCHPHPSVMTCSKVQNIPTKNQIPSHFHIFTVELSWGRERGSPGRRSTESSWRMPSQIKHKKWTRRGVGQRVHVATETRGSRCSTASMTWFTRPHKSQREQRRKHRPEFLFLPWEQSLYFCARFKEIHVSSAALAGRTCSVITTHNRDANIMFLCHTVTWGQIMEVASEQKWTAKGEREAHT